MTTGDKGKKGRVISGMRPTGKLHIGHYFGALQNWVRLQNEMLPGPAADSPSSGSPLATSHSPLASYECFYFIADWHALTSDYADTSAVAQNSIEIMTDYLAAGLDPAKSVIFLQSLVPEHAELHLLLSMVTPLGWLERIPTYKEALENIKDKDLHNYGFLGYPVLQCADITMYSAPPDATGKAIPLFVPVGEDQVSHVETSREIVRRFSSYYGHRLKPDAFGETKKPAMRVVLNVVAPELVPPPGKPYTPEQQEQIQSFIRNNLREVGIQNFLHPAELLQIVEKREALTEPGHMLTKTPRIPGLDGRKMSKGYGNTIMLSETDADIRAKTKVMVTDPARKRRSDPGNPDICPVYDWHKLFAPKNAAGEYTAEGKATLEWSATGCRTAGIGCIECKAAMAENLIKWITPVRDRRVTYEKQPKRVLDLLDEGSRKARVVAQGTMDRVREAVFGWEKKRKEVASETKLASAE